MIPAEGIDASVSPSHDFTTTQWSVVLRAADAGNPKSEYALEQLCRNYWYPLYVYIRRQGRSSHDAQDLTQGFFARVIEKGILNFADPKRGRFRTFLLSSLKNFLASDWKKGQAQKRGGGEAVLSIDEQDTEQRYVNEPIDNLTPEHAYAKRWAQTLLDLAMERLHTNYADEGKEKLFQAFRGCILDDSRETRCASLGAELGLSEGAARVALHRMRENFRHVLRAEVAETVESSSEIDDELRHLITVLRA